MICEEAILVYPDCSTKNEILDDMVRILTNIGYVKDDFYLMFIRSNGAHCDKKT